MMRNMVFEIIQLSNGDFVLREKSSGELIVQLRIAGGDSIDDRPEAQSLKQELAKQMLYAAVKSIEQMGAGKHTGFVHQADKQDDRIGRQFIASDFHARENIQKNLLLKKDVLNRRIEDHADDDIDMETDLSASRTLH